MAALDRASLLTLAEIARYSAMDKERLVRVLGRLRVRARSFPHRAQLYEWTELESALSAEIAERIRRAARREGVDLRPTSDTVVGVPRLLDQWNWRRNATVVPWRVGRMSTLTPWWKCPAGSDHEWTELVHRRNTKKRGKWPGCPFCAGQRVSHTNCLATRAPAVAKQWHPTKNAPLTPRKIQAGSSRPVWWQCGAERDHVWRASPGQRTGPKRIGCPMCASRRVVASNSLRRRAPAVAAQWHPTRNGSLGPEDIVAGSTRLVWWRCGRVRDHVWRQSPKARVLGRGCPFCAGKKVSITNCLAKVVPALASQWHPTKNGKLTPRDVVPGSAKKIWWRCPKDAEHVWRASPNLRTSGPGGTLSGCPFCAGRRVASSNSLARVAPDIAKEWHPTKNGRLTTLVNKILLKRQRPCGRMHNCQHRVIRHRNNWNSDAQLTTKVLSNV